MYYPIDKGSVETIQHYDCQLPPVGYGKNRLTGEIEYIGVREISKNKKEQKWQPISLPKDWIKRRQKEFNEQEKNKDYFDEDLEKIRTTWWKHRLCGEWIKINGKETYIIGSHWYYLTVCKLNTGDLPDYRDVDRKLFYVWEYCVEDPRCAGLCEVERRRAGKTAKAASILLDRATMLSNHHGGIQSKTSESAKKDVFLNGVIRFWKNIPDFFRPVFDESKGDTPTTELRFYRTVQKGSKSSRIDNQRIELESFIDWGSADKYHYDGSKLHTYVSDEFGKLVETSIWERHNVVRYCLAQGTKWIGKALYTSTIEEFENGGEEALKLWNASDPSYIDKDGKLNRDANGRTKSGLYTFFLPAYETTEFDEFGISNQEESKAFLLAERESFRNDPNELNNIIRRSPFTIEEAFRVNGTDCIFNAGLINDRLELLSWSENLTTKGNFVWENGVKDTKVIWQPTQSGRWEICWLPKESETNRIKKSGNNLYPDNVLKFVIGADPFSHDTTKDKRRSDGAAMVLKKFDSTDPDKTYENAIVCKYLARPETSAIYFEDMIKTCVYYGCQILFENNKNNWHQYFKDRCYENFLIYLPGQASPGIHANAATHQELAEAIEDYVFNNCNKIFYKKLLQDLLEFRITDTTKYDIVMAFGYALLATKKKLYRDTTTAARPITDYIRKYKVA